MPSTANCDTCGERVERQAMTTDTQGASYCPGCWQQVEGKPRYSAHNAGCLERQKAHDEFVKRWPNYCKTCGGCGCVTDYGDRWTPPSSDPCACVENGKCPYCAGPVRMVEQQHCDYAVCDGCGWDELAVIDGRMKRETCPETDCYCWEEAHAY